ncbi:hypothetical protein BOTCAL_0013g00230 [Botryotinia calthae]|uniref:YDG domain-containing protein n=1 Tax=Botryotinia calthae TaxID=38488 RepID=A0A4Y8DG86_9HELO|nr:hypothetical protein BOTCAL_0013g00230 [Botryotinia calthae]
MSAIPMSTIIENPKVDLKAIDRLNLPNTDAAEVKFEYVKGYMFRRMRFQRSKPPEYYKEWRKDERDPYTSGHNGHLIGDWWPYPISLIRDRAHGAILKGVCGKAGVGAVSIIVGSGGGKKGYKNIDNGNTLGYCGDGTNLMDLSLEKGISIRVIRGANSNSVHAPPVGYRYDGLYKITGKNPIPEKEGKYRYELVRVENQKPMNKLRPTDEEIDEFNKQDS